MRYWTRIFGPNSQRGGMLVELLLSVAIMAAIIPFIFRYQTAAVTRTKNIAVARNMEMIQTVLERYIMENRDRLLRNVGRTITRVAVSDLIDYGLDANLAADADKYQVRILKSGDATGQPTLQGVIVFASNDITPLRTREIVNMGGDTMGFIEDNIAFGAFGAWHADTVDMGLGGLSGIVETTTPSRGNTKYLWRVPTSDAADATMQTGLNLGGHDIVDATFFDASVARFSDSLAASVIATNNLVFQNRTTINQNFFTDAATVNGTMSSDGRSLEIANTLKLSDVAKLSNFTVGDLWVSNMTLSGLSINTDEDTAILKINQIMDMTRGRITTLVASVGFAGSVTPRLVVRDRVEDSVNPNYYWDASSSSSVVANMSDMTLAELTKLAPLALKLESGGATATRMFRAVTSNKNATAGDFMNAINQIQESVREKYRRLNLE